MENTTFCLSPTVAMSDNATFGSPQVYSAATCSWAACSCATCSRATCSWATCSCATCSRATCPREAMMLPPPSTPDGQFNTYNFNSPYEGCSHETAWGELKKFKVRQINEQLSLPLISTWTNPSAVSGAFGRGDDRRAFGSGYDRRASRGSSTS